MTEPTDLQVGARSEPTDLWAWAREAPTNRSRGPQEPRKLTLGDLRRDPGPLDEEDDEDGIPPSIYRIYGRT
jgi:hypothetical protein